MGRSISAQRLTTQGHPPAYMGAVGRWSNPATWVPGSTTNADLPIANQAVTIPVATTVYLDCDTASIGDLTINGTLIFDPRAVSLTASSITIGATGTMQAGTGSSPFTNRATITLTGAETGRVNRYAAAQLERTCFGNGRLARVFPSTGAVAERVTVTWTSAANFSVTGTTSGAIGSGTNGLLFNNKIRFIATAGATPFQAGDNIVVPLVQKGFKNSGGPRSLQVMDGGKLILIGVPPSVYRTRLNAQAAIGTGLTFADDVSGWSPGDNIAVGPTDFSTAASGTCQRLVLNSKLDLTADTSGGITATRWGVLQYVTDAGMALSAGTITKPATTPQVDWDATPKTLDQRAMVVHLTRNIVIQGVNDSAWQTNGFGAHLMFMGLTSQIQLKGVEIRRTGQAGANGRYPLHWHMASYNMPDGMDLPSDGTFLGAKTTDYVTDCSIHTTTQRAVVFHGTHGIVFDRNVCFDITGHALFLEDGVEQNNFMRDNAVLKVQLPTLTNQLVTHDKAATYYEPVGSSGVWLSNPNNTLTGNWFANTEVGIWNSFSDEIFGLSIEVVTNARSTQMLLHSNNISACNAGLGMSTEFTQSSASGELRGDRAYFAIGGFDGGGNVINPFDITGAQLWKNRFGGYLNRIFAGNYKGFTTADNGGRDFNGAVQGGLGVGSRILGVSDSLNNATVRESGGRAWAASYHELLAFVNSITVGYKATAPVASEANTPGRGGTGGIFGLNDLYTDSMFSFTGFTGLKQINQAAPFRTLPPQLDGQPLANRHYTFAGVIKDVNGSFVPAGRYWIFDAPFFTTGCTDLQPVLTDTSANNGKHTSDIFYGVQNFVGSFDTDQYAFKSPVTATRQDTAGATIADWIIGDGTTSVQLGNMRHFNVLKGGRYLLTFPTKTVTSSVGMTIRNFSAATDIFMLGVQFAASSTVANVSVLATNANGGQVLIATAGQVTGGQGRLLNTTGMTSATDIQNDTTGLKYWHDKTNGIVWLKVKGGLTYTKGANTGAFLDANVSIST